jgi:iron complex transport system permease protein
MTGARLAKRHTTLRVIVVLVLLILCVILVGMNIGAIPLTPMEVLTTLVGQGSDRQKLILFDFRFPRIIMAILVGSGLSVSGVILQGLTRNPLADTGILGINTGAGFFVILYIVFFKQSRGSGLLVLPLLAFAGGIGTAALVYFMSLDKRRNGFGMRMVLIGIGINTGLGALTTALTIRMEPLMYEFVVNWFMGTIWGANRNSILILLPWLLVLFPLAFYHSLTLDVLWLDEDISIGLGLPVGPERLRMTVIAVGLSSVCVALSGAIGFVGLIAPHAARTLVGEKSIRLLPVSALMGTLLVLSADIAVQFLFVSQNIPTGIAVSFIGAPYFLYRVVKAKD